MHSKIDFGPVASLVAPRELVTCVRDEFPLGPLREAKPLGGDANVNILVSTDQGKFVLKVSREYSPDELRTQFAYESKILAESTLPLPAYARTRAGDLVHVSSSGRAVTIQNFSEGEHPDATQSVCQQMGEALASLHRVSFSDLPAKSYWMSEQSCANFLSQIQEFRDQRVVEQFQRRLPVLQHRLHRQGLPESIIHTDSHLENVLFQNNQLSAWLDWEEVSVGPSVIDIGLTAVWTCFDDTCFLPENFRKLLGGYESLRELSQPEKNTLTDAMEYALLIACCWRFVEFGIKNDEPEMLDLAYERLVIDFQDVEKEVSRLCC